jgi:hypothetical protein
VAGLDRLGGKEGGLRTWLFVCYGQVVGWVNRIVILVHHVAIRDGYLGLVNVGAGDVLWLCVGV